DERSQHELDTPAESTPKDTTSEGNPGAAPLDSEAVNVVVLEPDTGQRELLEESSPTGTMMVLALVAIMGSIGISRISRVRLFARIQRWFPVAHVLLWSVAFLMAGLVAAARLSTQWLILDALVLGSLALVNLSWLRSALASVVVAMEGRFHLDDHLRVGEISGHVVGFGLRSVRLRAEDGTVHDVPNEHLLRETVANLSGEGGDAACAWTVMVPEEMSAQDVMSLALEASMLSPLASPRHRPEAFLLGRDAPRQPLRVRIQGYAFAPSHREHFKSDVQKRLLRMLAETDPGFEGAASTEAETTLPG
ncbi:MAG: mechanosensitive ion channel domain-containing protein, partial [Myxococcota bacterium]